MSMFVLNNEVSKFHSFVIFSVSIMGEEDLYIPKNILVTGGAGFMYC